MFVIMTMASLDAKVPEFLVQSVGCRIFENLEKITDDTVEPKSIPSIAALPTPILQASRLKKLVAAVVQGSPLDVVLAYHAIAKRFANSVPKDFALRALEENDEAERLM